MKHHKKNDLVKKIEAEINAKIAGLDLEGNSAKYIKKAMWVGARIAISRIRPLVVWKDP